MVLNWCFNEPWPTAANNSLINYPARPKDALKHVKKSLQPVVLSARVPKFSFYEGEIFTAELFVLNDLYQTIPELTLSAYIQFNGEKIKLMDFKFENIAENQNAMGPIIKKQMPHYKHSGIFKLLLECKENKEFNNEYEFMYYNKDTLQKLSEKSNAVMDFVGISDRIGDFTDIEID